MTRNSSPSAVSPHLEDLIDTHCHLDGEEFAQDLSDVLEKAANLGVRRWINVGYSPDRWKSSIELAQTHAGMSCMLGVHPGHASDWNAETAEELRRLVKTAAPVAIGEIGLDFYRGETNVSQQVTAFTEQLGLAHDSSLPVSIHMRSAEAMTIDVLDRQAALPPLLFHSFEGSDRLVDWIRHHHAFIGVGGLATRSKSQALRASIARLGLDRIVLETDSPYLVPNGFKHRRNTPESIPTILRAVAELFGTTPETVAQRTTDTACRVFRSLPPL